MAQTGRRAKRLALSFAGPPGYRRGMIAFFGFAACVAVAMLFFPHTPFARLCHRELVERPVAALSRFRSHHILYAVILVPVLLSGGEFVAILGADFLAAYAMELAIYFDAMLISVGAAVLARIRHAAHVFRGMVLRRPRTNRPRGPRSKRRSTGGARKPANDDEPRPARIAA